MKHALVIGCLALLFSTGSYTQSLTPGGRTDSLFIKAFATGKNNNKNGLHLAYSYDRRQWTTIGDEYSFVRSDYGPWGQGKRMLHPKLLHAKDGLWYCVFDVDEQGNVQGMTSTTDFILWKPQEFLLRSQMQDLLGKMPVSETTEDNSYKVPRKAVDNVINHIRLNTHRAELYREKMKDDGTRFAGLKPIEATLKADFSNTKRISDKLIGVFFEDINYGADGGLYAELVQNRDFEYSKRDNGKWDSLTAWHTGGGIRIATDRPLHPNNPHYVVIGPNASLINEGFDGIALSAGDKYELTLFARAPASGKVSVRLVDIQGNVVGNEAVLNIGSKEWKKYRAVLTANKTVKDARLQLVTNAAKEDRSFVVHLDMISLFPQKTFRNRENGLRADLAQAIADLKPRFVRFPGGCVSHGNGLDNIYRWKSSVGPLESRKPDFNLWGYHQSMGLGFYEYFQFCEDIGAEPLPVLAAGLPCQNSRHNPKTGLAGQQGGIPLDEMDEYIQEIFDLIEYANGDAKTTFWGRKRAEAGHPKPFGLRYLGIGNEDLISEVFKERFSLIFNAVRQKYPEITVIGTTGPFYEGADYEFGWDFARQLQVPMVDEHYYVPPAWMIHNQQFYDLYDRSGPNVYLGEYAAHLPGSPNNVETALAEALHLCNIERNGDVVAMTSYAPLLAKEGRTQWNPDMIYFNNAEVKTTAGYEVQKMFGNNSGDEYIYTDLQLSDKEQHVNLRIAKSVVRDTKTGDVIIKLANLLPVETSVELKDFAIPASSLVEKTVLQGDPEDKVVKSVTGTVALQGNKIALPKYSFTVLKIKK